MGRKLVLTGTKLTDLTAPLLATVDPAETPGSLLLLDLAHPANPMPAGLPANAATVPNLLAETASALVGSAAVGSSFNYTSGLPTSGQAKIERSARGGLHYIHTQTTDANTHGAGFAVPDAVESYMLANGSHVYALAHWLNVTRTGSGAYVHSGLHSSVSGSTNKLLRVRATSVDAAPGTLTSVVGGGSGPQFTAGAAVNGWNGTPATSVAGFQTALGIGGTFGGFNTSASGVTNSKPSAVFYRAHLIDVTAAAAGWAMSVTDAWSRIEAAERAAFTRQVLTEGGRYYGDTTPTAPSAIA